LINIGIYHRGDDVAETGTSWLKNLAAMHTLRPFSSAEIVRLGRGSVFIPATWSGLSFGDNEQIWGIPIRSDMRIILYWRDMLEDAGVNLVTAFDNHQDTHETLDKLKSIIDTHLGIAISPDDPNIIQTLATWVCTFGGDMLTQTA
jgi:ABC-type glycerol-3-phosphate transport system substrate-binding protein